MRSRCSTQEDLRVLLTYEVTSASFSQLAYRALTRQIRVKIRDVSQGLELMVADATIFSVQTAFVVEFANPSVLRAARSLYAEATSSRLGLRRSVLMLTSACGRRRLSSRLRAARNAASPRSFGGPQGATVLSLPLRPRRSE